MPIVAVTGERSAQQIQAEIDVDFDIGKVSGSLLADHCVASDRSIIE